MSQDTAVNDMDDATAPPADPRPRIRSGAIAWGLIVLAVSGFALFVITDSTRREDFLWWVSGVTPGGAVLVGALVIGCFILLLAGLALIRRAQNRMASRRAEHPPIG